MESTNINRMLNSTTNSIIHLKNRGQLLVGKLEVMKQKNQNYESEKYTPKKQKNFIIDCPSLALLRFYYFIV